MYQVRALTNKEHILSFLQRDRTYAAYAIGDLEPSLFAHSQWFGAANGGEMHALALFFTGLQPPALFAMGDSDGVAAILDSSLQPERAYFTCLAKHLAVVEASYALDEVERMFRMTVAPSDFQPVHGPAVRLNLSHLGALRQLYRLGGGDAFAPYQLRDGIYYGVEVSGQLVSAAGTHLISPAFGVAAVGNIFTHPDHRRQGYGTACSSQVVEELLTLRRPRNHRRSDLRDKEQSSSQNLDIVLNVNQENTEAISIYQNIGFRKHCPYIEVIGTRNWPTPAK